jgi:hypothetical protein
VYDKADTHVRRFDKNSFSTEATIVSFRDVKCELTAVTRTRWLPVSPLTAVTRTRWLPVSPNWREKRSNK